MIYKICGEVENSDLKYIKNKNLIDSFIWESVGARSAAEVLQQKYDVVEVNENNFESFKENIKYLDWNIQKLNIADYLIKQSTGQYKAYNLIQDAIIKIIRSNKKKINSLNMCILVGKKSFILPMIAKLIMAGFIDLTIAVVGSSKEEIINIEKSVKTFLFNVSLKFISVEDLTTIEESGYLFISNFKKETNPEAYELLTYFNFLSTEALFIDCCSIESSLLVDEANKAEIQTIGQEFVIENKYQIMLENLKIST